MKKSATNGILLILFLIVWGIHLPETGFTQSRTIGNFSIDLPSQWTSAGESEHGDAFLFRNDAQKIEIAVQKEPVPCANPVDLNKLIVSQIQILQKEQWIIEQRKPAAPCSFAGQKTCHLMKVKSRSTGQQKFILNPLVKSNVYRIEVTSGNMLADLPADAVVFISGISTADSPATPVKTSAAGTGVVSNTAIRDNMSGMAKVQAAGEAATVSGAVAQTGQSGVAGQGISSGYDPAVSQKAANVPDGDEAKPVFNAPGTVTAPASGAGWALSLAKDPGALLDALSGNRPGGDVQAMMALLRQTQGPFDESEEKAMMSQYASYTASGSTKAGKSIRNQSEQLLKAMIHRQLLIQSAWEYDFALAQHQMAEYMQDEDEKEIATMLAEIQSTIMQEQQTSVESLNKQMEAAPQIPSSSELQEEQKQMRENAVEVITKIAADPGSSSQASVSGEAKANADGDVDAMVQRYHALREEHRVLQESCAAGVVAACDEQRVIYKEAMEIRKKLEEKGINVLDYKKPEQQKADEQAPSIPSADIGIPPSRQDPSLTPEQNQAIGEHEANIGSAQRVLSSVRKEMATEKDPARREELRLQALHMEQNIHDSKDLIESIRTGTIVKTRGPWDEHAAVVLAETSRKLREDFQRAAQMQASYVRMLNILKKYNPAEAEKFRQDMSGNVIKGIFDPGGFEKAQKALTALYSSTKGASQSEQTKLESQQQKDFDRLAMIERHLEYAETLKSGCDMAIFVGTIFTGLAPGLALSMAYEGACTGIEKGPAQAAKNMAIQGASLLAMQGLMKAGSWGINKILNPKVAQSEVNSFKKILEANRHRQEMEWNQALVNQLKEKAAAFEKCKATGGKNYLEVRKALDDAVSAANSSSLAKRIMKNELTMLENQIKSGATRDYSRIRECVNYQNIYNNRLQKSIYPRTDAEMIKKLQSNGYNVQGSWFQEYRNACSRGINADRDAGLLAQYEKMLTKNGQPVSLSQFMDDAQKAYNDGYKAVTGRSAKLADQTITTSAHSESFPVTWLQKKMQGPHTTLDPPVDPKDFEKAGKAIYNKVQNALAGPDPSFANMKKACASLGKDLKTKVLDRIRNAPAGAGGSPVSRQAALQHWEQVQKVLDDFASDKTDPFTAMRRLQELTGSSSISQSAAEVQKLLSRLGGATR